MENLGSIINCYKMKKLLRNKIVELQKELLKKYDKNKLDYFQFSIAKIEYISKKDRKDLVIYIEHYLLKESIKLTFKSIEFYFVTEESYSCHFNLAEHHFSFLGIMERDECVDFMLKTGYDIWFKARSQDIEDFFIVQVLTTDHMVNIFTDYFPEVEYVDCGAVMK